MFPIMPCCMIYSSVPIAFFDSSGVPGIIGEPVAVECCELWCEFKCVLDGELGGFPSVVGCW